MREGKEGPALSVLGPARHELAHWLLQHEGAADAHRTPSGPFEPTQHVLRRLSPAVTRLVTTVGYRALLARALDLTRGRFPLLESVNVGSGDAFIEAPLGMDARAIDDSLVGFIGTLITLLATFIGDDLTDNLIRDTWPDAPLQRTASRSGGTR